MVEGEKKKKGRGLEGDVHLSPSPTSSAQTGNPLAHREHTSRAFNTYCQISPWYQAGSCEVVLGGGVREGSLKGAPPTSS